MKMINLIMALHLQQIYRKQHIEEKHQMIKIWFDNDLVWKLILRTLERGITSQHVVQEIGTFSKVVAQHMRN